ncbi:MAG: DUF3793 family protein [Trichlorobacter sp.]|uniref:DUF3793 family protein n=1 Tax=Trichlorobacter sp. TaxID=2911007 RepID=UPI00256E895A|nr:DUF3793 family protein [Trichlorobacter sp.]
MGFYQSDNQGNTKRKKTALELLAHFNDPLDCLTAHLMLECSEVLAGVKPANLVSLVNRTRPCGRNLYQLWQSLRQEAVARLSTIDFLILQTKERSILLLCYNREQLEQHLSHAGIRTLLHKAGYKQTSTVPELLTELKQRISKHDHFPHEIGLFIGYPAKDVAAFMGLVKLPFSCQALWKIYGNPANSLNLAKNYRCCRERMTEILASGSQILVKAQHPEQLFFYQHNDIDFHILKGSKP